MHSPNQRTALAALDAARPIIARLDATRHPDDVAADLIESWAAVETALRSLLGGSALAGQALVSEVRQRGLLDYRHVHSLLGWLAARDRAGRNDYHPTDGDVDAARSGFQALETALGVGIGANTGMYAAVGTRPPGPTDAPSGMLADRSTRPTPSLSVGDRPTAARPPEPPLDHIPPGASPRGLSSGAIVVGLLALLVVAAGGWWWWSERQSPRAMTAGIEAYRAGQREVARRRFEEAVDAQPKLALPHVYLARLAREDGDMPRAYRELNAAIGLEPGSAVAQREMGQYLLQTNQPQLARNFLERAIRLDPEDRTAQGWMGCALVRLGNADVADRFFQRAGQGDWTACQQAAPAFPGPGGVVQPPAAAGTLVPPGGALPRP